MLLAFTLIGQAPTGPPQVVRPPRRGPARWVVVALLQASLSPAVSSTTTRKAAASAGVILILLASAAVSDVLVNGADAPAELFCLRLRCRCPSNWCAGSSATSPDATIASIPTATLVAAYLAWTIGFSVFTWVRYRNVRADR